jgi:hypothetical protein
VSSPRAGRSVSNTIGRVVQYEPAARVCCHAALARRSSTTGRGASPVAKLRSASASIAGGAFRLTIAGQAIRKKVQVAVEYDPQFNAVQKAV